MFHDYFVSMDDHYDKGLYPLMGTEYSPDDFMLLDLNVSNPQLPAFRSIDHMTDYIKDRLTGQSKKLAYGGYLERRNLYKSDLFEDNGPVRDIHLGVDVWCDAMTPLYLPSEGFIYGMAYNGNQLDYGYTLIVRHENCYSLYGHLSHHITGMWEVGQSVGRGDLIAYVGEPHENGGWSPHVHFQLMIDVEDNVSDYPGVCAAETIEYYQKNCPDPISWILPQ